MARCKVSYKINDESFDILGIKKDNTLTFMENDIKFKINIKENDVELIRENNEYKLKIILSNDAHATYELKNVNVGKLNIDIKLLKLDIKDHSIKAKYKLDDALFNLDLKYEVIKWL